jgi:hypothetical protein
MSAKEPASDARPAWQPEHRELLQYRLGAPEADAGAPGCDGEIGPAPPHINVIKGSRPMTAELALLFGKAFGQSPQYWLNLQAQFDLMKAERSIGGRLGSIKRIASP